MRTHTTNIKNEVRRHIRPTNVLFNGILYIYKIDFPENRFSVYDIAYLNIIILSLLSSTIQISYYFFILSFSSSLEDLFNGYRARRYMVHHSNIVLPFVLSRHTWLV